MKEFALLFRFSNLDRSNISSEEMKALTKKWMDWAGGIAAQGKLANNGITAYGRRKSAESRRRYY